MGGFRKGGFSNNRFVLKPDVAIASEVSILSKSSLAITDFHVKKTQHVQLFENPLPGTPPFAIPNLRGVAFMAVLAVLTVLESHLPCCWQLACPSMYRTKTQF